jgi:uncharacterized integral membrane protein
MGRIIFSVVLLVLLTVLIVMNLGPTAPINLFGAKFDKIPVVAVAMLSFVLGVVYSLFLYVGQYVHRTSRERLAKRHRDVEERERKLDAGQGGQGGQATPPPSADAPPDNPGPPAAPPAGGVRRFFRMFR